MDTSKPLLPKDILTTPSLTGMNTRHLLALLRRWRKQSGVIFRRRWYRDITDAEEAYVRDYDLACTRLREELSRRGHVPICERPPAPPAPTWC